MHECSVIPCAVLHTLSTMQDSWQKRYIRHVRDAVERDGGSLSAVARAAGISTTTLTRALKEGYKFEPKLKTLEAVEKETGISFLPFREAAAEQGHYPTPESEAEELIALVPVYDVEASAGAGLVAPDHEVIAYRLELPADYLSGLTSTPPSLLRVIRVKGTSMLPTLKPGDLVMLDPTKNSLTYDGLFVLDVDGAILVKRVGRGSRAGTVNIISDSREQPPVERAMKDVRVIGKVIWRGVKE
jgi:phage repressor protein C with HTH and peptisase S24 domain